MPTAAETFSLETIFTANIKGTIYAIIGDEGNLFVVPAANLAQDADDDSADAYAAWCEAGRVDEATAGRMFVLSEATDAVWEAAEGRGLTITQAEIDSIAAAHNVKPAWLAQSAHRHYLVTVITS